MKTTAIVLMLLTAVCCAQPEIEWQISLGGTRDEAAFCIRQTFLGDYVIAGYTGSDDGDVTINKGGNDYWIVYLEIDGVLAWEKTMGGSGDDLATSVNRSHSGGYVIAGYSNSSDGDVTGLHANYDYWILELDPFRNLVWQKCLGGYATDYAYDIHPTYDGNYIITGLSQSNNGDVSGHHGSSFYNDYWTVKIDTVGNIIWQKSLGGSLGDNSYSVCEVSDGGFIVAGYSNSTDGDITDNHGSDDFWIVKLTHGGNIDWQKSLGGTRIDRAFSIRETHDSGFIIAGTSYSEDCDVSENKGSSDYWIVKLDYYGTIEWEKSYGGGHADIAESVYPTSDGGYVIAGQSFSSGGDVSGHHGSTLSSDYWVIKLDSLGELEWEKSLGGSGNDQAYSICQTHDGGYIVAGRSKSSDGDITSPRGEYDMWIVKLAPYEMNVEAPPSRPSNLAISAYPNPFNSAVTIALDGALDCHSRENGNPEGFTVEIFDLAGRKVAELPSPSVPLPEGEGGDSFSHWEKVAEGRMRALIWTPAPSLPSGVYLVRATTDNRKIAEKRVIYLK